MITIITALLLFQNILKHLKFKLIIIYYYVAFHCKSSLWITNRYKWKGETVAAAADKTYIDTLL